MKRKIGKNEDISSKNKDISSKKKKKEEIPKILSVEERERRKTSLYRAPTSEELNELRENENLYKNNLFRMQIQYLLEEVCLPEKKTKKINDVLHQLNDFLCGAQPSDTEFSISEGDCIPSGIMFPLPKDCISFSKIKGRFKFVPPKEVKIVGSYLLQTITTPNNCIDVAIEIPKECLQPRDCINYRYYFKRSAYLCWIAKSLQSWTHTDELRFSTEVNRYKPCLVVKLKGKIGKRYFIKLHVSVPEEVFKLNRFSPLKNNVRSSWFEDIDEGIAEELEFPTPRYNSGVLSDMLFEKHLQELYAALKECPGMKEAICLCKVWLRQRSFKGQSTFNGFICSMLMLYLLQSRKISSHMSSYQIFRQVLNFLATTDWTTNGISLCDDSESVTGDFHGRFDVVFVDQTGFLNLCANVDKVTYEMVKNEASMSLSVLDNPNVNGFEALFIHSKQFLQSVDHSFQLVNLAEFKLKISHNKDKEMDFIDHGGDWTKLLPKIVYTILKQGLDKRIRRLIMKPLSNEEWQITSEPPCFDQRFLFGLQLDTEFSDNILVMGPPADQPEAKEFRSFWGERSELRRFQDGSINEAVLWACSNEEEKKLICRRIVQYLLNLHCNIPASSITYHADEFNRVLKPNPIRVKDDTKKAKQGCGEEESIHFIKMFDELCKHIRSMTDLPLKINSIHGIDPAFRMTEVFAPRQHVQKLNTSKELLLPKYGNKCPRWCPVYNVLIQFETSGKWPDDLVAIQHIKAAFHLKIANCLRQHLHVPAQATPTFVDVIKSGYVFRIFVVHYREMVIHKELSETGVLKHEHELASNSLETLLVKKPLHTTLIHRIVSSKVPHDTFPYCLADSNIFLNSQFHGYAVTTRLCKRWIASHMLTHYLCDEAIELIVAFLFLNPTTNQAPGYHFSGFLMFLYCLSTFDWENEPMIVNLNDQITEETRLEIIEKFSTNRSQYPPMFIPTSYDSTASSWTKDNPKNQILRRLRLLADAALKVIDNSLLNLNEDTVKQLFRPTLSDYDVVIELNKEQVPNHYQSIDSSVAVKINSAKDAINSSYLPVVNFNPAVIYVQELREAFQNIALFFYDPCGGLHIGVVWKTDIHEKQPFKVLQAHYKMVAEEDMKKKKKKRKRDVLTSSDENMVINVKAILSDFRVIGRDLVLDVRRKVT